MSVQNNPFVEWEDVRENSDYRSRETQASALTRQMMKQEEYLRRENRVNPGPYRNTRAASVPPQSPHGLCNEDVWGWQRWTEEKRIMTPSDLSNNLLEGRDKGDIPGC